MPCCARTSGSPAPSPVAAKGACGVCAVLLDGEPVRACVTHASEAGGRTVTTVEGLSNERLVRAVQESMVTEGAIQCGYCEPGMVVGAVALLSRTAEPAGAQVREAMSGHVCRCCAYGRIERAIGRVAAMIDDRPGRDPARDGAADDCLPQSAAFWDFRPRTPWDLSDPMEREHFELLGDGLVVSLEPEPDAAWSSGGGAWLHYGLTGTVTAFTGKVEMGQDNRTALSLIVADELQITPSVVRLAMGDTDLCPSDIGTFGSRSLPGAGEDLRICSAAMREWLAARGDPTRSRAAVWRGGGR